MADGKNRFDGVDLSFPIGAFVQKVTVQGKQLCNMCQVLSKRLVRSELLDMSLCHGCVKALVTDLVDGLDKEDE